MSRLPTTTRSVYGIFNVQLSRSERLRREVVYIKGSAEVSAASEVCSPPHTFARREHSLERAFATIMSTDHQDSATPKPKREKKTKNPGDATTSKSSRKHQKQAVEDTPLRPDESVSETSSKKRKRDEHHDPANSDRTIEKPALKNLAEEVKHSPFTQTTASLYLALSPICQQYPLEGLCAEHLSPLLLTYYPPLKGVILSYSNPRLSEHPDDGVGATGAQVLARSVDEYAVSFVWLTAELTLLRPGRGTYVEGWVNLQNESHIGLICYNYYNASIDRRRLPKDWQWVGTDRETSATPDVSAQDGNTEGTREAHFVDGQGNRVEGLMQFRLRDFEASPATDRERGFLSMEGTLLDEEEDAKADEEEKARQKGKAGASRPVIGPAQAASQARASAMARSVA
ncbi:hypothetical protein LTR66_008272 [Elasticomyces elasticus]|nr:hypothetical protein LTR66_008272 [Elasticomyces elasticus]